jgi:hypothetical protein
MRKSPLFTVLGTLLGAAAAFLVAPASLTYSQIGQICDCAPDVTLAPDPTCPCPDITIANVVSRFGKCNGLPGNCGNTTTLTCKVTGTVSEINCQTGTTGFVDQPFEVMACCKANPVGGCDQVFTAIPCTNGGGAEHHINLDCGDCH